MHVEDEETLCGVQESENVLHCNVVDNDNQNAEKPGDAKEEGEADSYPQQLVIVLFLRPGVFRQFLFLLLRQG